MLSLTLSASLRLCECESQIIVVFCLSFILMFNAKNLLLFKGYHKSGGGGKHSQNRICLCALIVFFFSCVLILSNLMVYYSAGGFNRFVY